MDIREDEEIGLDIKSYKRDENLRVKGVWSRREQATVIAINDEDNDILFAVASIKNVLVREKELNKLIKKKKKYRLAKLG